MDPYRIVVAQKSFGKSFSLSFSLFREDYPELSEETFLFTLSCSGSVDHSFRKSLRSEYFMKKSNAIHCKNTGNQYNVIQSLSS